MPPIFELQPALDHEVPARRARRLAAGRGR